MERLLILAAGPEIGERDVRRLLEPVQADGGLGDTLMASETFESFKENAEKAFLRAKLQEYDWNVSETARKLGMPRSNLYKKIERFNLTRDT